MCSERKSAFPYLSQLFLPFLFCVEKPGLADLSVSPAGLAEFDYGFPSSILRDRGCQSDAVDEEFVNFRCSCVELLKFVIVEPKWQALRNLKNIHFYVGDQDELGTGLRHRKDSNGGE